MPSTDIPALIAEARSVVERHGMTHSTILIDRLTDALEATVKEMHARELHHFEEEQARAHAEAEVAQAAEWAQIGRAHRERVEAERDRYRAALEDIRAEQQDYTVPHDEALSNIGTILSRALNDDKEAS